MRAAGRATFDLVARRGAWIFALVFAFTTAVGRVCLGLATADSSRYIPYVLPGLLAVHLVLRCGVPAGRMQVAALAVFVSICVL